MADRSHLIPTPITDRKGKQTTVYRKADPARGLNDRPMAAPSVARRPDTDRRAAEYAERLTAIAATNESWRTGQHPGIGPAVAAAFPLTGVLMSLMGRSSNQEINEGIRTRFEKVCAGNRFTAVSIAHRFGAMAILHGTDLTCPELMVEDPDDRRPAPDLTAHSLWPIWLSLCVAEQLHEMDLLAMDRVPELADARMRAHLWMAARKKRVYSRPKAEEQALIRVIDEHPERVNEIARHADSGWHAAEIHEHLVTVRRGLASGAL